MDGQANQLNQSIQARAFTTGQDVFFRQGEYNPRSRGGQELLAHELTHVLQQKGGQRHASPTVQRVVTYNDVKSNYSQISDTQINTLTQTAGIDENDNIQSIFNKLVAYGQTHFEYESGAVRLTNAINDNIYNCETVSELFVLICLKLKNQLDVARPVSVSSAPLLYRGQIGNGGFNNQESNVDDIGQRYVVYSSGHTMANVNNTLYDVTTGQIGGLNNNYITGDRKRNARYEFKINNVPITLVGTENTRGGLQIMRPERFKDRLKNFLLRPFRRR